MAARSNGDDVRGYHVGASLALLHVLNALHSEATMANHHSPGASYR